MGFFSTKRRTSESAKSSSFAADVKHSSEHPVACPSPATIAKTSGAAFTPSPLASNSPIEAEFTQIHPNKASRYNIFNSVKSVRPSKNRSKTVPNVKSVKYSPPTPVPSPPKQSPPALDDLTVHQDFEGHNSSPYPSQPDYVTEPEEYNRSSVDSAVPQITVAAFRQARAARSQTSLHSLDADSRSSSLLDLRLPPTARTPNATRRPSTRPLSLDPDFASQHSSYFNLALQTSSMPSSPQLGSFPSTPLEENSFFEPPKPAFLASHLSRSSSAASLSQHYENAAPPRMENRRSVSEKFAPGFQDPPLMSENNGKRRSAEPKRFSISSMGGSEEDADVEISDDEEDGSSPNNSLQIPVIPQKEERSSENGRHGWESSEAERQRAEAREQVRQFMQRPSSPFAQSSWQNR